VVVGVTVISRARGVTTVNRGTMSKQAMREEAERLIKEAMERKSVTVKEGDTRIDTHCGKCGALNKVKAPRGQARVEYTCKECGHKQRAL
jgi:transposase